MHEQSPIDLPTIAPFAGDPPAPRYRETRWRWRTAEFSHGAEPEGGSAGHLAVDGDRLQVTEIHTHAPSEHAWDGRRRAGEIHVVHTDGDAIAVLGIGLILGAASPAVQRLLDGEGSVEELLAGDRALAYTGSLTTPPYTPGVNWAVLVDPLEVSDAQLDALVGDRADNARDLQSTAGRTVHAVTLATSA